MLLSGDRDPAEQVVDAATHLQAPLQVLENAHAVADVLVTIWS